MKKLALGSLVVLTALSAPASATVIEAADVVIGGNTFQTFQDTTTSLTWLDLDNFWDGASTYNSITSLLAGSGFHLATSSELAALQASIPAITSNFATDATITGGNLSNNPDIARNLMWGIYDDGNASDGVSWSWKFDYDTSWSFSYNVANTTTALSNYNPDLGAWVVSDNTIPVSLPSAISLFGIGFAAMFFPRKKNA